MNKTCRRYSQQRIAGRDGIFYTLANFLQHLPLPTCAVLLRTPSQQVWLYLEYRSGSTAGRGEGIKHLRWVTALNSSENRRTTKAAPYCFLNRVYGRHNHWAPHLKFSHATFLMQKPTMPHHSARFHHGTSPYGRGRYCRHSLVSERHNRALVGSTTGPYHRSLACFSINIP